MYLTLAVASALGVTGVYALPSSSSSTICTFHITALGGPEGQFGQLYDGQNRLGQGLAAAQYSIGPKGGLTDSQGRGCILTPPTTQFQCDAGATPTTGFSISCEGALSYGTGKNANGTFHACPTGDNGGYNIYTESLPAQDGCEEISLSVDACIPACPSASSVAPSPASTSARAASPTPYELKTCQTTLTGEWEFPHLIIPIEKGQSGPFGSSYNGTMTSSISSIFNFDIPSSYAEKTCSLNFLFPNQAVLETSAYEFSGSGYFEFSLLAAAATTSTTYGTCPAVETAYGMIRFYEGNSYSLASMPCPAGERIAFLAESVEGASFNYFQDSNPSPIGLYITVC